jgi:putative oxidoreductase
MLTQSLAALAGRILLAALFLWSGAEKVMDYAGTLAYMRRAALPYPEVLLFASAIVEMGCGAALVVGWKTRGAAAILFLWLIAATAVFHNPASGGNWMVHVMKNLAIMGGMLMLFAFGPGAWSAKR